MNPDIFIDDFEITDNTEELHAIIGRSLVIATRFDNLCDHIAKVIKLKTSCAIMLSDKEFESYVTGLFNKLSNLNNNIHSLPIGQAEKDTLHNARKARNEIAHNLTVGMTGCLDLNFDEDHLKNHITTLIEKITLGDFLLSTMLSILNKDPLPNFKETKYQKNVVDWVLDKRITSCSNGQKTVGFRSFLAKFIQLFRAG